MLTSLIDILGDGRCVVERVNGRLRAAHRQAIGGVEMGHLMLNRLLMSRHLMMRMVM